MKMKKILIIYTGGTFGMSENLEIPDLSSGELKKRLEAAIPEMKQMARCSVEILFNTDSCQMGIPHWLEMAELIRKRAAGYDGAVILHGTDTLAYTASALSFLLAPAPFPVVITGAQKPLSTLRNDARSNFLTALEVAAGAPGKLQNRVLVAFHDELFLGSRVRKKSAIRFSAFESPRFPVLARVGSTIQYTNVLSHLPSLPGKNAPKNFKFSKKSNQASILKTEVTPEFPGSFFTPESLLKLDAILLTLYTSGTAPTEVRGFTEFLKAARRSALPVFAITEREDAPLDLASYPAGRSLLKEGVLWCKDLTPESAFVKAQILHLLYRSAGGKSREEYLGWLSKNWKRPLSDETG